MLYMGGATLFLPSWVEGVNDCERYAAISLFRRRLIHGIQPVSYALIQSNPTLRAPW